MIKKVVISPSNKKAVAFLEELNKKKAEIRKRLEERSIGIVSKNKVKKIEK